MQGSALRLGRRASTALVVCVRTGSYGASRPKPSALPQGWRQLGGTREQGLRVGTGRYARLCGASPAARAGCRAQRSQCVPAVRRRVRSGWGRRASHLGGGSPGSPLPPQGSSPGGARHSASACSHRQPASAHDRLSRAQQLPGSAPGGACSGGGNGLRRCPAAAPTPASSAAATVSAAALARVITPPTTHTNPTRRYGGVGLGGEQAAPRRAVIIGVRVRLSSDPLA